ncbi:MAG: hypothetical protein ACR2J8_03255 [Thermomicrobiales bacterium]
MSQNPPPGGTSSKTEERLSGRAQRKLAEQQAHKRQRLWIFGGLLLGAVVLALLGFMLTRRSALPPVAIAPEMEQGFAYAGRTMGDPNAPVKVVEWGDYQ